MAKQLSNYLLLILFTVFTLTSNAHVMPMDSVNEQPLTTISTTSHQHLDADISCQDSTQTEKQSCCQCDCSCMMNHCNNGASALSNVTIFPTQLLKTQLTYENAAIAYSNKNPRKRPPKA